MGWVSGLDYNHGRFSGEGNFFKSGLDWPRSTGQSGIRGIALSLGGHPADVSSRDGGHARPKTFHRPPKKSNRPIGIESRRHRAWPTCSPGTRILTPPAAGPQLLQLLAVRARFSSILRAAQRGQTGGAEQVKRDRGPRNGRARTAVPGTTTGGSLREPPPLPEGWQRHPPNRELSGVADQAISVAAVGRT